MTPTELLTVALIGLAAGALGGMLGIGGSVLMIPGLIIAFHDAAPERLHLYQAAAMATNIAVAAPAAHRHGIEGAVRADLLRRLLPAAAIAIVAGVLLANRIPAIFLQRLFAIFLVYVAITELMKLWKRRADHRSGEARLSRVRVATVGGSMGFVAGLLGVGGGVLAVPLMQRLCRIPLREAIGASSAAMVLTATVGAIVKMATLEEHGLDWKEAGVIALALIPTAVLGSALGARLTHRLPLGAVRGVLLAIVIAAAWRLSGF